MYRIIIINQVIIIYHNNLKFTRKSHSCSIGTYILRMSQENLRLHINSRLVFVHHLDRQILLDTSHSLTGLVRSLFLAVFGPFCHRSNREPSRMIGLLRYL